MAKRQRPDSTQRRKNKEEEEESRSASSVSDTSEASVASSSTSSSSSSSSDSGSEASSHEDDSYPDQEDDSDSLEDADDAQVARSEGADSESEHEEEPSGPAIDVTKTKGKLVSCTTAVYLCLDHSFSPTSPYQQHAAAKRLRSTAKKARTFELQRLVKKLKSSRTEALEREVEAVKALDTGLLAARAFISKLVKAKLLPRHTPEDVDAGKDVLLTLIRDESLLGPQAWSKDEDGPAEAQKAASRVLSSKVLADEVTQKVEEISALVGVQAPTKGKDKGKQKQEEADQVDDEDRVWSGSEEEDGDDDEDEAQADASDDEDVSEEDDDEDEAADEDELERIGREKIAALGDLSEYDQLLGSGSEAEEGSESDSDSDSDSDSEPKRRAAKATSETKSKTKTKRKRSASPDGTSTFLPSLSVGFIGARSDDDWSDAEADLADRDLEGGKVKKERRNRMGQRARKAPYEKKYGRNANHIKLREKEKRRARGEGEMGSGWAKKRVALPSQEEAKPVKRPRLPPSTVEAEPAKKKPAAAAKTQEMHPSWVAKQKQKELASSVKPAGTKITFD